MSWTRAVEKSLLDMVGAGLLPGASTLVWRRGKGVETACAGWRDVEAGVPMTRDTLFRIASMTKPVTSVAALMLMEKGRFALKDPIARWAPEFANVRVLRDPKGPLEDTVAAERPITFEDLLTHRSGMTYGPFHQGPLMQAHVALGGDLDSHLKPDAWMAALARIPLLHQPGLKMHYGHSTDLLGLLLGRMENAPLEDVLSRNIFEPLGMADTFFTVPVDKHHRRSAHYGFDDAGKRARLRTCPGGSTVEERPPDMAFSSGGQGLWSTVDDYLAFARIFIEPRLLKPETLALMVSNQLTAPQRALSDVGGVRLFNKGHGFGLGVAVVMEPGAAMPTLVGGGLGSVGWPGGFGGWWRADPTDGSVMVFLCHNMVERAQFENGIGLDVYGAMSTFQTLAAQG